MISLLLTLFISLFSICPAYNNVDQVENNNSIKRSVDLLSGLPDGSLSTGYITNYFELANSETWLKMEQTFGDVWSDFTTDTGGWTIDTDIVCSGLYMQIPQFIAYDSVYTSFLSLVQSNYSSYAITKLTLYNRLYSLWSQDSSINTRYYYGHRIDFWLSNNTILAFEFYKSVQGQNQSTYSLHTRLISTQSWNVIESDVFNYSLFATDTFTYTDTFFVSDYWLLGEGADEQYRDGYQIGYNVGVETGQTAGHTTGYGEGYQDGYQEGLAHADYDSTALTIMQGIIDVGLLPVNVFLMILNFEVFGVNVSGFVSALLTISIVIIIVRFLFGGKSDGK